MDSPIGIASGSGRREILLRSLYGEAEGVRTARELDELIRRYTASAISSRGADALCERDVLLITYADQVYEPGIAPLRTLASFCERWLKDVVSGIHILPFYPWSSDDGFSVKDYFAVEPGYGTWGDIAAFRASFDLMFDAVFNHASAQGDWFQGFLQDEPAFRDFFVTVAGSPDLTEVVRPRALPLLNNFQRVSGLVKAWTTFSADQVDLNVKNPRVLLALTEVLLFYVERGARFIRLDAIAYLWKEIGTPCIHLPQTHAVIQLFRAVLDEIAPHVQLITETNVPHTDNISYFGDGTNEAQMVYNFALPPLVLHTLLRGDASYLARWAATVRVPSGRATFFNFLSSHDGIGLNPVRGLLPDAEVEFLVQRCREHGGFISYKHNPDGSESPYEMNIVYFDALNDPTASELLGIQVDRFIAAQAIMLSLAGVPGVYFHSLLGSRNDRRAVEQTGINRRINRQKLGLAELQMELSMTDSLRTRVLKRYCELLRVRRRHIAFNPHAAQAVFEVDRRVFAVLRMASSEHGALCLHNVTEQRVRVDIPISDTIRAATWTQMFTGRAIPTLKNGSVCVTLEPYEVNWLSTQTQGGEVGESLI